MTRYLLDTDTLIFLLKQNTGVQAHLQAVGTRSAALSVITVAEVLHGAYDSADPTESLTDTRTLMQQFTVVRLNEAIADTFGSVKAEVRRQGQILADFDLLRGDRDLDAADTGHKQHASLSATWRVRLAVDELEVVVERRRGADVYPPPVSRRDGAVVVRQDGGFRASGRRCGRDTGNTTV